jgi:hypothetical protein
MAEFRLRCHYYQKLGMRKLPVCERKKTVSDTVTDGRTADSRENAWRELSDARKKRFHAHKSIDFYTAMEAFLCMASLDSQASPGF